MKKFTATILLLAYLAFAPLCFAALSGHNAAHMSGEGMQGMHALSCVGTMTDCGKALAETLSEHSGMYHTVTSVGAMSLILLCLVFFVAVRVLPRRTTTYARSCYRVGMQHAREQRHALRACLRNGMISYLLRLIASPNLDSAFA